MAAHSASRPLLGETGTFWDRKLKTILEFILAALPGDYNVLISVGIKTVILNRKVSMKTAMQSLVYKEEQNVAYVIKH